MDPNFLEEFKTLAIQETENENSDCIQLALSNTVVLWEIFKFLPASTLKSCNLVNKLWKNECYTYCRDKIKWAAKISEESPCASLRDYNELIGSMIIVPYNGLSLHVDQERRGYSCHCKSSDVLFTNVLDKLTWRHLDILIDYEVMFESRCCTSCAVNRFGLTVLEQKMFELESLEFQLHDELQGHFNSDWPPALPNLKEICFPKKFWSSSRWNSFPTNFYTRLTNEAPNLKEIAGLIDYEILQLFPEEKWECVKDFKYSHYPQQNELQIASKFVSKRPALRKLTLDVPSSRGPRPDFFKVLIELSQMTMEDFEIRSFDNVFERQQDGLQMPQLPKLRVLRLRLDSNFKEAIKTAQSLLNQHGGEGFPQLDEFHLTVNTLNVGGDELLPMSENDEETEGNENGPLSLAIQPGVSVTKLRLQLDPALSSFLQIKSLFPAVTDLRISYGYRDKPSRLPYKQIFRLWQNLETLSTCYVSLWGKSAYKLDAVFCGLDEQEVDLLGQEEDDFLMAVELVPIAPCVLTMRNLLSFTIEYPNRRYAFGDQGTYLTRVARILAWRYLPNLEVNVP